MQASRDAVVPYLSLINITITRSRHTHTHTPPRTPHNHRTCTHSPRPRPPRWARAQPLPRPPAIHGRLTCAKGDDRVTRFSLFSLSGTGGAPRHMFVTTPVSRQVLGGCEWESPSRTVTLL